MADGVTDQVASVSISERAAALPETWNDQLKDESGNPLSKRCLGDFCGPHVFLFGCCRSRQSHIILLRLVVTAHCVHTIPPITASLSLNTKSAVRAVNSKREKRLLLSKKSNRTRR